MCGGKSENDEKYRGCWVSGWIRGSSILDPERFVDPLFPDQTARGLSIGLAIERDGGGVGVHAALGFLHVASSPGSLGLPPALLSSGEPSAGPARLTLASFQGGDTRVGRTPPQRGSIPSCGKATYKSSGETAGRPRPVPAPQRKLQLTPMPAPLLIPPAPRSEARCLTKVTAGSLAGSPGSLAVSLGIVVGKNCKQQDLLARGAAGPVTGATHTPTKPW